MNATTQHAQLPEERRAMLREAGERLATREVSDAPVHVYTYKNELDIAFTSTADLCCALGTHGTFTLVWRPQAINPDGAGVFASLGDVSEEALGTCNFIWGDPSTWNLSNAAIAMVRNHPGGSGTALAAPTKFAPVYDEYDAQTLWQAIPPDGYVALGFVATATGWTPPPLDTMVCLRRDLVSLAAPGGWAFNDDSGQGSLRMSAIAPSPPAEGEINFSPGTFVASSGRPMTDVNCLRLAIPEPAPARPPAPPELIGPGVAPPAGTDTRHATTEIPFFVVQDARFDNIVDQMLASPTYMLQRTDRYVLPGPGCVVWNQADTPEEPTFTVTAGVNGTESAEFSETTGIDIGAQFGNDKSPVTFSAHISQSFTLSGSISKGWSVDVSVSIPISANPKTTVAAYWLSATFQLVRADGSPLGNPVNVGLDLTTAYVEYAPQKASRIAVPDGSELFEPGAGTAASPDEPEEPEAKVPPARDAKRKAKSGEDAS